MSLLEFFETTSSHSVPKLFLFVISLSFFSSSVRMRKIRTRKNSVFGHFWRSDICFNMFTFRNKLSRFSYKNQHGESFFSSKMFSVSHVLVTFLLITPWIHSKIVKFIISKHNLKDHWLVELSHPLKNKPTCSAVLCTFKFFQEEFLPHNQILGQLPLHYTCQAYTSQHLYRDGSAHGRTE